MQGMTIITEIKDHPMQISFLLPQVLSQEAGACVSNSKCACHELGKDGGQCIDGGLGKNPTKSLRWEVGRMMVGSPSIATRVVSMYLL